MTLPAEGSAVEKNRLDCKVLYADGPGRASEMAKDVAAFANANGGRLLIGSDERGGILQKHVGLEPEVASKTRRAIEEAVRDFVRPAPVIDFPEPYRLPDGNVVLVVDVQPFPGQAVGVREGKQDGAAWAFPVRVGTQTVRYSPEQLVLLMDVRLRRNAQLLSAAIGKPVQIRSAGSAEAWDADLLDVVPEDNAAVFKFHRVGGQVAALPIDAIDSVWRNGEKWLVQVRLGLTFHDLAVDVVVQQTIAYGSVEFTMPSRSGR